MRSHLYCLVAICLFSTIEVGSKALGSGVNPNAIAAWRFLIGGAVILPFALRQMVIRKLQLNISSILKIAVLGILNVCISMLLLQWSVFWGKASLSAIIVASNPLFVTVFAWLLLSEKLGLKHLAGLGLGLIGLILIIAGESDLNATSRDLGLGIALALGAAITFGLYTVLAKRLLSEFGNPVVNSFSFLSGAAVLFLVNILRGQSMGIETNLTNMLGITYLGLFVTGLAYILFFESLKNLPAAQASMYFFLKPVVSSLLAYFILSELLSPLQIGGVLAIILSLSAGYWLGLLFPKSREALR
ncbi:MAG TPA: DMT family transporter [Candidatus Cloacimonadota bacterium]|nr:DMT family transporter [Candidatus Cloacimonadota bacterium]